MILSSHSDAYFHIDINSLSRFGSYIYLTALSSTENPIPQSWYTNTFKYYKKTVLTSITESEYSYLFYTTKSVLSICNILTALGHPQYQTSLSLILVYMTPQRRFLGPIIPWMISQISDGLLTQVLEITNPHMYTTRIYHNYL